MIIILILPVLVILILIKSHYCVVSNSTRYTLKSNFPIYEEEEFVIQFHATHEKLLLYTVIMLTCIKDGYVVEEHVLNPGFQKALPSRIYGEYFMIKNYSISPYLVEVTVKFNEAANNAQFEILFLESNSVSYRMDVIDKVKNYPQYKLGKFKVSLLLHWKLKLIQKTLDHREDGLLPNSTGILICQATGGFPFSPASFIGIDKLIEKRLEKMNEENTIRLIFHSRIEDHMKKIGCQAGNDVYYDTLKIFHHPTSVKFRPAIDGYVKNGTSIVCIPVDGYPTSTIEWVWISGPEDSEQYFTIDNSNKTLSIHNNAPQGSKWIFECIAKNTIPNSLQKGSGKLVSFIIGERPIPYLLICSTVALIVIFIIIFAIIIRVFRSRKMLKNSSLIFSPQTGISEKNLLQNVYPVDEV